MYAIQNGSKFVKVSNYYASFSLTATPKTYKTRDAAKADLEKVSEILKRDAARAREAIESSTKSIEKAQKELPKLCAKMVELVELPYREVYSRVEATKSAIKRAEDIIRGETASLRSFRQDLARYERIRKEGFSVAMMLPSVQ